MGTPRKQYRLRLKSLNFISAVDRPAQQTAAALLIKRSGNENEVRVEGRASVVKVDDELGIVFGWAMTPTAKGETYYDLQGDAIDEESMLKAAAEFMAGARTSDVMHNESADGTVVFGMPLTKEIAKAFGVETDTTGLMVGIKPSSEVLEKFKSGEFTGFSIGGTGVREEVAAKGGAEAAVIKRPRLTTDVDGHSHLLDDGNESGITSGAEMHVNGCYSWHTHPYLRNEDGSITIGAAMGHTHEVAAGPDKRAPSGATTHKTAPQEITTMTTDADRIKSLEAEVASLKVRAELTDAEKAFADKLGPDARSTFLAKSATDRQADVAKATEVVYTGHDGAKYTASDDPRLVTMAKRADESARAAAEVELEKRANEVVKNLPGDLAVRKALLSAVSGIADETTRNGALAALKAGDAAIAQLGKSVGHDGSQTPPPAPPVADITDAQEARAALDERAAKRAAAEKISLEQAYTAELDTPEGSALYQKAYRKGA